MRALVTGATGFIGSAVVRSLLKAGHEVRALTRAESNSRNLDSLRLEIAIGDMLDAPSLHRALQGCDSLFHVAADYRLWVPDPVSMYRVNVEGTKTLMLMALAAGIQRIVYTSTVATLRPSLDGTPVDESARARPDEVIGHYKRSKLLAEEGVLHLVREFSLPAVIVDPTAPVGPGDVKPTPTGRIIADAVRGRMPAYVDTGLNIVHVDDVARGHVLACEKGGIGERYILGGEDMTLREILAEIAAEVGRRPPAVRLPHGLVLPVAYLSEAWARLSGGEPRVALDGVRMARMHMFFSSEKAKRELGYAHRPAKEALRDSARWFLRSFPT